MRTVVAFLAMWVVGCGGRVAHDQPWAEQQIALPTGGEAGAGGEGGEGGGETTTSSSSTTTTEEEDCPAGCDDGNDCTEDACVEGECEHFGADEPDPCTTPQQHTGVCAWSSCVLTDCGPPGTDGELCFYAGGVGVCADGACEAPCVTDLDCDDGNDCTEDYCLGNGACSNPEDTLHLACGDGGNCWKGSCCEGCFDVAGGECVSECAEGTSCSALGACQ